MVDSREPCSPRYSEGSQDTSDPEGRMSIPLRIGRGKDDSVRVMMLMGHWRRCNQQIEGRDVFRSMHCLSRKEVCPTDERTDTSKRTVRNEGAARERHHVVGFASWSEWRMPNELDMQSREGMRCRGSSPTWFDESDGSEDGRSVSLAVADSCRRHHRKPSGTLPCGVAHAVQRLVQTLCGREGSRTSASEGSGAR